MSQYAYDYNPAKTEDYRKSRISEDKFFDWSKENLYRSSYATSYTDVTESPIILLIKSYEPFPKISPNTKSLIHILSLIETPRT